MSALDLYRDLQSAGLALSTDGQKLLITHASGLTDALRAGIRQHKQELIAYLLRGDAANDSAAATDTPAPPAPEAPDWRVLDSAYQDHHFKCPICIAAGIRPRTGQRCGVGAALWVAYETAALNTPPPWRQPKVKK